MLFFADNAPKTPYVPIKTQKRINFRPLRTQAKYGAANGVYAPFFFSAVKLKFCINRPLFLRNYALFRKKTQWYENKQEKAEGLRCFPLGGSRRTATPTARGFVQYFKADYKTTV